MRRWLGALLTLALVASACVEPTTLPARAEPESPAWVSAPESVLDMTAALRAKRLPAADVFSLTRRIRGLDGAPSRAFEPVRATPPSEAVGATQQFWIYNFDLKRNERASATLRLMTEHVKWWVVDGIAADAGALGRTAEAFETRVYPTNRRLYGSEWSPGIDGDPRINVLLANIPGAAAGYYSITDEQPRWINEFSAEREILFINALAGQLGSNNLNSVLAHEFCHMIQTNKRVPSVVWMIEGHAQLCETGNGLGTGFEVAYLRRPDTQLNDWPDLDGAAAAYGGAYLFLEFLRQKAGGEELINALLAQGIQTPDDVDRVLRARGKPALQEVFADFVAANALVGQKPEQRYAYSGATAPKTAALVAEQDRIGVGQARSTAVRNYAARYIELPRASIKVRFNGASGSRVIPTDAHSGRAFWWSDRADSYDATLTRAIDLRGAASPLLTFWTWYEIEKEYDYAYVAVSTDGGASWRTLPGTSTTTANPLGHNLGNGYTSRSGGAAKPPATWVQERVDLAAYAGKEVLLRFEYVTDEGRATEGFAIDDVQLSTGFTDDAETDVGGWTADGFIRSTNLVREEWVVQLLRFSGDRATVERHVVSGVPLEITFDASRDARAPLLAVTPFAVRATETVPFEVAVEQR